MIKPALPAKQKRQAEHIEDGYEKRSTPQAEAERRAWATVDKETGGGKKSGEAAARSDFAKKAAATRRRNVLAAHGVPGAH